MAELFDAQKTPGGGKQTSEGDDSNRPGNHTISDAARTQLALEYSLKQQMHKAERANPNAIDLVGEAGYSALYQGLQSPIISAGQVSDNLLGKAHLKTNIAGFVDRLPAPEHEEFGTARWHAQQIGGAAGMILPFVATKGALSKTGLSFAARTEATVYASSRLMSAANAGLVADGAISGFAYDFLLRPVDKPDMDKFWETRTKHGLTGAATFGTLTAGSVGLRHLTRPLAAGLVEAPKVARIAYDAGMGALPGIPAGVVSADLNARLTKGRWATGEERMQGAYTMTMAGGALSALHAIPGSDVPIGETARAYAAKRAGMSNLESMLAERARAANESQPEASGESKLTGRTSRDGGSRSAVGDLRLGRALASADAEPLAEKMAEPTEVQLSVPKELVETLQEGVDLAFKASDTECTPQQVLEFFKFARGEGAPLKEAMLEVARQYADQDPHMMTLIREAYMPPEGVESRVVEGDIKLKTPGATTDQYQRWAQFMQTVREMPQDIDGYIRFRHDVFRWLNNNKDLHDWALQYGQQNRYSKIAGPLDYYFGTSSLSRFIEAEKAQTVSPQPAKRLVPELPTQGFASGLDSPPIVDPQTERPLNQELPQPGPAFRVRPETLPVNAEELPEPGPAFKPSTESDPYLGRKPTATETRDRIRQALNNRDVDTMMQGFETGGASRRRIDAVKLADRIGEMSTEQFAKWLDYAYAPAEASVGTTNGGINLKSLFINQRETLLHPDVVESYLRYRGQTVEAREGAREIPLEQIRKFLAQPPKAGGAEPLPEWQQYYIEARLGQVEAKQTVETAPHVTLNNALPRWFVEGLKTQYVKDGRLIGERPTYSDQLPLPIAKVLEAARRSAPPPEPPKFGEKPKNYDPPPNTISLRLERLNEIASVNDPVIRDRLFELGAQDHVALRSITQKLDPTKAAPEYEELLRLVLPEANNIKDVKMLLDAIYFGNKANRSNRDSETTAANMQLAMATAEHIVPQSSESFDRVQQLVQDFVTGKIRDPRPPRDGGDGGGGGPGPRGGGGGRENMMAPRPFARPAPSPFTSPLDGGGRSRSAQEAAPKQRSVLEEAEQQFRLQQEATRKRLLELAMLTAHLQMVEMANRQSCNSSAYEPAHTRLTEPRSHVAPPSYRSPMGRMF